jgi:hypothetical protein
MNLQQEVAEKLKDKGSIAWHADQLNPSQKNDLPAEWVQAIGTENLPAALELTWKPWLPFTQQQPEAFELLQKTLHGLAIYTDNTGVSSLLYVFRFKSGRLSLMTGYLPQKNLSDSFNWWSITPEPVGTFYEQVHNGWISMNSKDGGPSPSGSIETIDFKKLDLPAGLAKELPASPENCFQWYRQGDYTLTLGVNGNHIIPFLFSAKYRSADTEIVLEEIWNDQLLMLAEEFKVR